MGKTAKTVKTVSVMMFATALSKVLGMVRSMLMASHYGTGIEANAFSAASRIPLSFFDILFSAAIIGCFIPIYNGFGKEKEDEADRFASVFLNCILLLTGILALLGIVFARPVIYFIASGLSLETKELAVTLLRIMFPLVIFAGGAYTLVGIMQSKGRFILPAMISAISNAGVILYFIFFDKLLGDSSVYWLCAAYLISWIIQFITLALPLRLQGFKYSLLIDFKNNALRKALKSVMPIMVGSWLLPVSVITGTYFSSKIAIEGNVTVFDYTYNVYIIIAGILSYSICNYVFPKLSKMAAEGDGEGFNTTVRIGIKSSLFIMIPFMFGVFVLAGEGIAVLYMRNEFGAYAAVNTARALKYAAFGMPAFAVIEYMSRVFYSKKMAKIPMLAAIAGVIVNIVSSAIFVNFEDMGIGAATLGFVMGEIAAASILIVCAGRTMPGLYSIDFLFDAVKIIDAGIISMLVMMIIYRFVGNIPYQATALKNILVMAVVFIPSSVIYLAMTKVLKLKLR